MMNYLFATNCQSGRLDISEKEDSSNKKVTKQPRKQQILVKQDDWDDWEESN